MSGHVLYMYIVYVIMNDIHTKLFIVVIIIILNHVHTSQCITLSVLYVIASLGLPSC